MPIRVIFCSDTHLGFDEPVKPRINKPRRGPDFFDNFQRVLDHARQSKADLVVHGGDLFFRSKVHPAIVDRAYQMLYTFADSGIPIVIVPGNHERSVLPPSLFLNHPGIHVFDEPRTYVFDIEGECLEISGFPYVGGIRRHFKQVLRACDSGGQCAGYRLLCFHHAVQGAVVGPAGFTFNAAGDVIAARDLPQQFDLILSGHIHRHQVLSYPTPVVFCGSIERTSFAEQHETKGFCELHLDRASGPPRKIFHPLPTRPMVDFDGRNLEQPAMLRALAMQSAHWCPTAIVRLRLAAYPDRRLHQQLKQYVPGILQLSVASGLRKKSG